MEKVLEVTKLLGEDNVNRLKDTVTDLLIERCRDELDDMAIYMVDYEQLFAEVEDEVRSIIKDRVMKAYLEKAEGKISELFESKEYHMTKEEKLIVSAYTGILMTDFDSLHEFIEKKLGRPVWTHELANELVVNQLKEAVKEDFLRLCAE